MCFRFLVSFCLHSIQIDLYAEKRNNKFHLIIINWYFIMLLGAGFAQAAVVQRFLNIAFKYCNRIQWLPRAKQQWQENETHRVRRREWLWVRERKREKKKQRKIMLRNDWIEQWRSIEWTEKGPWTKIAGKRKMREKKCFCHTATFNWQ